MNHKPFAKQIYGSIPYIPSSPTINSRKVIPLGQEYILTNKTQKYNVYMQEKMDGSCVGVTKLNGEILALTRNGYLAKNSIYKQHNAFDLYVQNNMNTFKDLVNEGDFAIFEYIGVNHGTLYKYMKDPLYLIDYFIDKKRQSVLVTSKIARKYGFNTPITWYMAESIKAKEVYNALREELESKGLDYLPEGLIYRCEKEESFSFIAKWVRPNYEPLKYIK